MKKTLVIISTIMLMLCMCLSVVAADVPSVEIPEAPEVMNAVINKGDDTEKNTTYDITTLEQAKNESTPVGDALIDAFEAFDKNPTVSVPALKNFKTGKDYVNPVFSVTHAFALEVADLAEGDSVTVSFKNDFGAKQGELVVIHQDDKGAWQVVPADKVVVSAETVDVTFDSLCPVMFLSVEEAPVNPPVDADKPDNSVMTATIVIVSVTVVIIGGIVVFYVLEKKGVLAKFNKK